jgi:hypothetical protein
MEFQLQTHLGTHTNSIKECDRCVGWVEQSETQRLQDFRVLG